MDDWPAYPYPASKTNPYSVMSRVGAREGHPPFFVTCMKTLEEAQANINWLDGLRPLGARRIYKDGKPL